MKVYLEQKKTLTIIFQALDQRIFINGKKGTLQNTMEKFNKYMKKKQPSKKRKTSKKKNRF